MFAFLYLGIFLLLDVFAHVWVEMLCVSFIQTVDFSLFLNLHISVHQDELADRLENAIISVKLNSWANYRTNRSGAYRVEHEAVDPLTRGQDQHGGAAVQSVASCHQVPSRLQSILLAGFAICGLQSKRSSPSSSLYMFYENLANSDCGLDKGRAFQGCQ